MTFLIINQNYYNNFHIIIGLIYNYKSYTMNPIIKKISDMSSKNRYLNKYSGDVVSATLIILILLSITAYYQAQNNLQPIRNDWENQKCKINILPISGFIRPSAYQSEKSNLQYTADNYKECMGATSFTILKPITAPFDIIIDSIKSLFESISNLGNILYDVIDFLRSIVSDIMAFFFGIIKMLIKILRQIMAAIGTFFYKSLLIFFVGVLIVKSFIGSSVASLATFIILMMAFIVLVVLTLAVLYGIVTGLYSLIVSLMPLFVTPAAPVAMAVSAAAGAQAFLIAAIPIVMWSLILAFAIAVMVLLVLQLAGVSNLGKEISRKIEETTIEVIHDVRDFDARKVKRAAVEWGEEVGEGVAKEAENTVNNINSVNRGSSSSSSSSSSSGGGAVGGVYN